MLVRFALIYCQSHPSGLLFNSTNGSSNISLCTPCDVNVVSVCKQLEALVENSDIAMYCRLSLNTLQDEIEEVA